MPMQWPGFTDDGGLLLPLDADGFLTTEMPLRLRLDGHVLERKRELHLTLLNRRQGQALRDGIGGDRVRAAFESLAWEPRGTGRYALLHKTKDEWDGPLPAWAVVEHLHEPALSAFRHLLTEASGLALDSGVPHVTLYVAGDPGGIGVPDVATYQACYVREVDAQELSRHHA